MIRKFLTVLLGASAAIAVLSAVLEPAIVLEIVGLCIMCVELAYLASAHQRKPATVGC